MRWKKTLQVVDAHCEGEIGRVVTSGVLGIPGETMLDKMTYINEVDDTLRRFLIFEPRGHVAMSVNLLLPPIRDDADAAFMIFQGDKAHPMSGSNSICMATVLLETGMVEMLEPKSVVRLETPAGLVTAHADCRDGKCERVTLDMVPSFVQELDVSIETERFGTVRGDVVYGGCFYVLVDAADIGMVIAPENARKLAEAGMYLKAEFESSVPVEHPEHQGINQIAYVMFRQREDDGAIRTCTTMSPGRCDRSPCGTGSSAQLAAMHARGEARPGDVFTTRSIIGGEFRAEVAGETTVAGQSAILPRITGRGWIYGMSQFGLDPTDPFPLGSSLTDTWGPNAGDLGM